MNELTKMQFDVLCFCWDFWEENDQIPPLAEIAKHFGFSSPNSAQVHMVALRKKGYIEKNAVGKWRFAREE